MKEKKYGDYPLRIAYLGHKNCLERSGGIEVVVYELATRMAAQGHKVTCYNRSGHHVSGSEFDAVKRKFYKGVRLKYVLTVRRRGLAAMTSSISAAFCAAVGKYDIVQFSCGRSGVYVLASKIIWEKNYCHNSWFGLAASKVGKVRQSIYNARGKMRGKIRG